MGSPLTEPVAIALGGVGDLDPFIALLEEAADWLWSRGVPQWEPGSMRAQRSTLLALARADGLVLARSGETLVGGCTLSAARDPVWGSTPGSALYLHKLVVSRAASGQGVGGRILGWCKGHARARGIDLLRLDCWDGSAPLRAYYRAAGFAELEAAPSHGFQVRLFERRVRHEQRA